MSGQMWFGTRDLMMWVKCPAITMPSSKKGWATKDTYLNGGANVRRSTAAHKAFTLSWNMALRDEVRPITDYADRLFGDGALYWADPFTMDKNALPQWFAAPSQGLDDGIPLHGEKARGVFVATPGNNLKYPVKSIRYTVAAAPIKPKVWIPIPPGYVAWIGAHGQAGTGGTITATPTTSATGTAAPITLPLLSVTDSTRVNTSVDGSQYGGVLIGLGDTVGTIVLSGIMVQILPLGTPPSKGDFISGQGHSGCSFEDQPDLTPYSAALDRVGLIAKFVETEGWRV